jgi:hypothetical protein
MPGLSASLRVDVVKPGTMCVSGVLVPGLLQKILPVWGSTHMFMSRPETRVAVSPAGAMKFHVPPRLVERRAPIGNPVASVFKAGWNKRLPCLVTTKLISPAR